MVIPISQLLQANSGFIPPCVRGIVTDVFDQTSGTNEHGDWKIQNIWIKEGESKIKVKVTDREALPKSLKGHGVVITCKEGDKGLTGMKVKEDNYRGKSSIILSVTPTATIEWDGMGNGHAQAPSTEPAPHTPPPTPPPAQMPPTANPPGNTAPSNGATNGNKVSVQAKKRARDYFRVMEAAHELRLAWNAAHADFPMTAEQYQAAVGTLYITLQRDGVINGGD